MAKKRDVMFLSKLAKVLMRYEKRLRELASKIQEYSLDFPGYVCSEEDSERLEDIIDSIKSTLGTKTGVTPFWWWEEKFDRMIEEVDDVELRNKLIDLKTKIILLGSIVGNFINSIENKVRIGVVESIGDLIYGVDNVFEKYKRWYHVDIKAKSFDEFVGEILDDIEYVKKYVARRLEEYE